MILKPAGVAVTTLASGAAVLSVPRIGEASTALSGSDFPRALEGLSVLTCAGVSLWLLLIVGAEFAHCRLPGVPRALRGSLFSSIAVAAIGAAATAPAAADEVDGLRLPDRPEVAASVPAEVAPTHPAKSREVTTGEVSVTVRAGDSIWRLAAERLPADTTTADIARSVTEWHLANQAVIGSDPDSIYPGQRLVLPTAIEKDTPCEQQPR